MSLDVSLVWSTPSPVRFANHHAGASHSSRPSFGPPDRRGRESAARDAAPFLSPGSGLERIHVAAEWGGALRMAVFSPSFTGRRCRQADEGQHERRKIAPHPYPLPVKNGERGASASRLSFQTEMRICPSDRQGSGGVQLP
jgi:hypothetical protein